MKRLPHVLLFLAIVFGFATAVRSQNRISDEKRKLISELVVLMKMESQGSQMTDSIMEGMEKNYSIGFAAAVDSRPDLSESQKEKIKATSSDRYVAFSRKLRKRMSEVVDYSKYIQEAIVPLYDKLYAENELADLIAFYRTPTGQKVIDTMPQLFADAQKAAREKFLPQILPIIVQMIDEEFKNVDPPSPKTNNR